MKPETPEEKHRNKLCGAQLKNEALKRTLSAVYQRLTALAESIEHRDVTPEDAIHELDALRELIRKQ